MPDALDRLRLRREATGLLRPAVSAARHHDDARSALQHRVSLRGHLSVRTVSRTAPGDPIWRSRSSRRASSHPDKWQYWDDIGFVYYWNLHDYRQAAEAFNRGADCRGHPGGCVRSRRRRSLKGGDRGASRLLWRQMGETAATTSSHAMPPAEAAAARRARSSNVCSGASTGCRAEAQREKWANADQGRRASWRSARSDR